MPIFITKQWVRISKPVTENINYASISGELVYSIPNAKSCNVTKQTCMSHDIN